MKIENCKLKIILLLILIILTARPVAAQSSVKSPSFHIDWPNMNMGAGLPSADDYVLNSTLGQTGAGLYESSGFRIRAGFQYIKSIIPFYFSISKIAINFGSLEANIPKTDTSLLTVQAGGAGGYQVLVHENKPLTSDIGSILADTNCDPGDTCTESDAGTWTENSTTGFGFSIAGDDVPSGFTGGKYKQFANKAGAETAQAVMAKTAVTWDYPDNAWPWQSQATITYKINRGTTQPGGTYRNQILFTAIPSF